MDGPAVQSIQDFLLTHGVSVDAPTLLAEVERHRDRTMTVVYRDRTETITRCRTCPKEQVRPCSGLRALALPYAAHPAYRPEWALAKPDDDQPTDPESSPTTTGEVLSLLGSQPAAT